MAKYGIEKLSVNIADSILDFVNSAFATEVDNLDLADTVQEAIDNAVEQLDFSKLLNESIDTDSSFQDWLDTKFEKQVEPDLNSIREDFDALSINSRALIESLESRLRALESIQNDRKSLTWKNTLVKLWADFKAIFVSANGGAK